MKAAVAVVKASREHELAGVGSGGMMGWGGGEAVMHREGAGTTPSAAQFQGYIKHIKGK